MYFLQNLHLTCFFTILSPLPLEYASAVIMFLKSITTANSSPQYHSTVIDGLFRRVVAVGDGDIVVGPGLQYGEFGVEVAREEREEGDYG
jgi:hypothetical protein